MKQKIIGVTEAKKHFSLIMKEVEKGYEFIITRYGVPIAKIIPYNVN